MKNINSVCWYLLLFLLLLICVNYSIAQTKDEVATRFVTDVSGTGTSAAAFLEIGVGARATAMGGAYASIATDVSALYWNPAGISWTPNMKAEFTHSEWLAETSFDYVGIVVPVPRLSSAIGLSFCTLNYGEQLVRTVDRPEGTGEVYGARDFAIGLTYALSLTDRFSFGLTSKYIQQRIWSESGSAFAVDVGVFYNTMLKGLRLGACMSNFGSEIQLGGRNLRTIKDPDETLTNYDRVPVDYTTSAYPLPLLFRFGISYEMTFGKYNDFIISTDVLHPNNRTESICFGMEYAFADMFYFRGGYQNLFERDTINGLTFGGGVAYSIRGNMKFNVDYSWSDWGVLQNTQRFTVAVTF
jgi:hypothetical protein